MLKKIFIKPLLNKMQEGVNNVKIIMYSILTEEFSQKFDYMPENKYKFLASTVINEIFLNHNDTTKGFIENNEEFIENEIIEFIEKYPEFKQLITDAFRVESVIRNEKGDNDFVLTFYEKRDKYKQRQIVNVGGDAPIPDKFLKDVEMFYKKYVLKNEYQKHSP